MHTALRCVDLTTELGEFFALPPAGVPLEFLSKQEIDGRRLHPRHSIALNDHVLLDMISTGYVACGGHSGDAIVMGRTARMLEQRGIAIGALLSYPDIFGFGQIPADLPDREVEDFILAQVASLQALARVAGSRVASAKCHGALSFDVAYDERTAQVMARTLYKFDPEIALVCMAQSPGARVARDCGVRVIEEAYIDQGYDATGRVISRHQPAGLITDAAAAVRQFLGMVEDRHVVTDDGETIPLAATSFCLHSDTPNVTAIADAIVHAIKERGLSVSAPRQPGK